VNEEAVSNLIALSGQSREHVIRCLEMARGDPNVAFELCMLDPAQLAQMAQQAQAMGGLGGDDGYDDEDDGSSMGAGGL
jgi:hypothetical protein